jgi:hypothetical protein
LSFSVLPGSIPVVQERRHLSWFFKIYYKFSKWKDVMKTEHLERKEMAMTLIHRRAGASWVWHCCREF